MKPSEPTLSELAELKQSSLMSNSAEAQAAASASPTSELGGRFFEYRGFILLAFFVLNLWLCYDFIKPVVMGTVLSIILFPLMAHFDRFRVTAKLSASVRAGVIAISFTLLILIPVGILIFAGVQAVVVKIQHLNLSDFSADNLTFSNVVDNLGLRTAMEKIYQVIPMSREEFQTYATKGLAAAAAFGGSVIQGSITSLPRLAVSSLILIFTMFFLLIDGPRVARFLRENSIFNVEQTDKLLATTVALSNSVIVATIVSGAAQSGIVGLICLFTGTGNVILYTFITFVSSFLPLIGTAPMIVYLSMHAFASGQTMIGLIWLATIAVVATCDNVVRPYVIKGGAELHPMIAFVAAFGALDMIGFYGLFIGPIAAGLFFTLLPMVARTYPRRQSGVR